MCDLRLIRIKLAVIVLTVLAFITLAPPSTVTAPPLGLTYRWAPLKFQPPPTPKPTKTIKPTTELYTITAYTAGPESTGKRRGSALYGITASGKHVVANVTVACPANLPFGTVVDIESVGRRVCTDRGGAITDKRIDVYMVDLSKARKFGRQRLPVQILSNGSDVK